MDGLGTRTDAAAEREREMAARTRGWLAVGYSAHDTMQHTGSSDRATAPVAAEAASDAVRREDAR